MAVTKTEFQVNSGNPGWTAQQVLDALESALGPSGAGHHSGTAVSGAIRKIIKPTDDWDQDDGANPIGGQVPIATQTTPDRTFNSTFTDTGTYFDEWDYTDPSPPAGGSACILTVRRWGSAWGGTTQGKVTQVLIRQEGSGYTDGYALTIPAASSGGTGATDITFGTSSATVPEIKAYTTRGGTSNWWWKDTDIGLNTSGFGSTLKSGVCRVTNDASKTYGTTYYSFTVQPPDNSNPGYLGLKSGPKFNIYETTPFYSSKLAGYQGGFYGDACMDNYGLNWGETVNVPASGNTFTNGQSSYGAAARFPCVMYRDYNYSGIQTNGVGYGAALNVYYTRDATATDYPIKIVVYKADAAQDASYSVIQFQQVVAGDVETILSFSLNAGTQWGQNIWDLDDVFQGGITFYRDSERKFAPSTRIGYSTSSWSGNSINIFTSDTIPLDGNSWSDYFPNHYAGDYTTNSTRMRESLYGYDKTSSTDVNEKYYQTGDHYITNFDGAGTNEGTVDDDQTSIILQYYRNDTYDKCIVDSVNVGVNANANFHKPIKGLPVSSQMFPCPYYLPDDFVIIQLAVTPGATVVKSGDTITVSGSEVYTVIEASGSTNTAIFSNDNETVSRWICFCARTT